MNKQPLVLMLALVAALFSCQKTIPGYTDDNVNFNAVLPVAEIALADTAKFILTDNPDVISFYPGDSSHNYDYIQRTINTTANLVMKFQTSVANQKADTLDVLVSNDFSGTYDSANVAAATWKKMTNKFQFPTAATLLGTYVASGATAADFISINDSVVAGKPLYVALRYNVTKQNNVVWSVGKLGLYNRFSAEVDYSDATVIDSNLNTSATFTGVRTGELTARWAKSGTLFNNYTNSITAALGAQHWYISKAFNPNVVTPDAPIVIKNISQNPLTKYAYKYKKAGTYKAVFVASYVRKNYQQTFVKEMTITVK